ncbi:MAG: small, acid-soluble spore protein, alpha/beta type [Eubacteriales bacterium]|nr:small, acid-soluble spore protein, alpha/beta type [Eubacteriales bacterium]
MRERRLNMHDWRLPEKIRQKYEQAERFGLTEALLERGWGGLSARDAGRIGGAMRSRNRTGKQKNQERKQ